MIPILASLLPKVAEIVDKVIPDKAAAELARQTLELELIKAANEANIAQTEINKIEAANSNIWVSGWRPAIGWVCAVGVFWAFVGSPVALWLALLAGYPNAILPDIPTESLFELVFAMLGMAGLRSFDKMRGLTR